MTQQEIRNEIARCNHIIEQNLVTSHFELNSTIKKALEDIDELQKMCIHEYNDGSCIWCGKMEEK